jgi:hypothetical protein
MEKGCEKPVRQPGGIVPTQFGHFPSPGAVTALKEKVRIDIFQNLSVVDPDPIVSELFCQVWSRSGIIVPNPDLTFFTRTSLKFC